MLWWKRLKKHNKDQEQIIINQINQEKLSFKDFMSMLLSAYAVFLPIAIIILFGLVFLTTFWMYI